MWVALYWKTKHLQFSAVVMNVKEIKRTHILKTILYHLFIFYQLQNAKQGV
jgi:hypothetical protein